MSFIDAIGSLFQSKPDSFGSPKDRAIQDFFVAVQSYINREDLVSHIDQRTKALVTVPETERLNESIQLYRMYESFIISNKPLVVKQEFTRESLRNAIASSFPVATLPVELALFFLPTEQQKIAILKIALSWLSSLMVQNVGVGKLRALVTQVEGGNDRFPVRLEGDAFSYIDSKEDHEGTNEAVSSLLKLYAILLYDFARTIGQEVLDHGLHDFFIKLQSWYDYELIGYFIEHTPQEFLSVERSGFATSRVVSAKIEEATEGEVEKREESEKLLRELSEKMSEVEKQNVLLEETKRAMANILSDAEELEKKLKVEKDLDEAILNSLGEGLFAIDGNRLIILFNPVAEVFMGVSAESAIGKKVDELWDVYKGTKLISSEERPVYESIRDQKRIVYDLEDDIYYKPKVSGKIIPVAITVSPTRGGSSEGAVGSFRDISDLVAGRKALEEAKTGVERQVKERTRELLEKNESLLKAQEQISEGWLSLQQEKARMNASINSLSLGYIMTDQELNVLMLNNAVTKMLGIGKETANLHDIDVSFGDSLDLHAVLEECKNKKETRSVTNISFGLKYLRLFLAPILMETAEKDLLGIVLLFEDITDARLVERSRDEFFSIASHELRTPLTAIRGNTAMIQDYFKDALKDRELNDMVKDIHESSVRLIDIVNDFLNMSRLELKKLEFKNDFFDVVAMAKDVVKELATTGSEHKLLLTVTKPTENLPQVFADRDRVKEVLINLIGNSVKFTAEGGVTVSFAKDKNCVRVIVTDTGRGVALENQALLFRKFQQASDNLFTRDTTKGTGLGLYISRLIIESMKGTIRLDTSEVGKGSVFSFTLPTTK